MTTLQVLDALTELGIAIRVDSGVPSLNKPGGFAYEPELADLMPLVRLHKAAILEHFRTAVEPWQCRECRTTFYASQKDVKEQYAGRSPHWCPSRSCPQMRGNG